MRRYKKIIIILMIILLVLYACKHHRNKKIAHQEIVTVSSQPLEATLFYSGSIQPLKTVVVTSPAEGVIDNMLVHYGDTVKAGQLLFVVSSDKFQADYKTALTQYIKAKTDFINNQSQLKESEFLHQHQLISDDDLKSKKTSFYNAQLAMVQAKEALTDMMKRLDLQGPNLYDLKIEDIDKITKILHQQDGSRKLQVIAPVSGVVLLPNKDSSSETSVKKIVKGDQIKQGEVLAVIGDVSGLAVQINVSEFNINQLKPGQKVKITGAAFPDLTLEGKIAALDHQGQPSQNGMPIFPVEVIVSQLTEKEHAQIRMGMSAKVAIEMGGEPEITVPIKAVFHKEGQSYVQVKDDKTGKIRQVAVNTGATTLDSVVIQSNLNPGEKVIVPS